MGGQLVTYTHQLGSPPWPALTALAKRAMMAKMTIAYFMFGWVVTVTNSKDFGLLVESDGEAFGEGQ